ncbi:MAG: carbamoyl-phosphate synthase large subunit [Clostridia bacterium]|nr:carbamoyl-phosphate synthase large subunit [Clostridia bacterium]
MPKNEAIKKALVIGSGPIVIGQAAEFDYSGAQACRVLKSQGINVVLANSNPATIMTDSALADEIYLEPLTVETVARIIEKERPDGLLAGLGGQTGLTLSMQLYESGVLQKYGVKFLGSDIEAIKKAEDRELFRETMLKIHQPCVPSDIAFDVEKAVEIAGKIGYPVIVRPAYTLGGSGGGIAADEAALRKIAATGLEMSPITQILVEKCISGWKEIEFEALRDNCGNAVAVCSMENVDPVGIHTGDSIVVAPTLTLSDKEFQMLRTASLDIIEALGIVGGCNCQFALNPDSFEYAVIEVNPRVSRSSALASKATGYPIAKISTMIAIGYNLDEIKNEITGQTCACFEPALDYVVVKVPKWPFDKFAGSSRTLGTQMKATGEVMAIGQSFIEALMKAVRGVEIKMDSLNREPLGSDDILTRLACPDDVRLFTVFEALKAGVPEQTIHDITKIDPYFISCLRQAAALENEIKEQPLTESLYLTAKKAGFPDSYIRALTGAAELPAFRYSYKMVDTCAAEFAAETPYFYSCADEHCEARELARSGKPVIMVLGSGPIRIGQGIEFDYSSVHCVWTLKEMGYDVVIVNNNPETVSTDYDTANRLYFEPLTEEDVMGIVEVEHPIGVVVAFGGQTAIKLAKALDARGVRILGTSAESIDIAEDRERFDRFLESINMSRPKAVAVESTEEALVAARILGYPVLLRPSYVIGGQGMSVVRSAQELKTYFDAILAGGVSNSVLVDKYMPGAELEVDCISDGLTVLIPGIMEHIERAGIHSGDSIAVYPPYNLSDTMTKKICDVSVKIARGLGTKGIVNIQYLIFENELYVIEVNPRASRTVPYISKVTRIPMIELASRVMLGEKLADMGYKEGLAEPARYYAVKVPVFSFEKIADANSIMGPEMKSTGEVLGIGRTKTEALYKGLCAAGIDVHAGGKAGRGILISVEDYDYSDAIRLAEKFTDLGMKIYATPDTAAAIRARGLEVTMARNIWENNDIYDLIESGAVNYIVYTGAVMDSSVGDFRLLYRKAMNARIPCMTSLDTALALADVISASYDQSRTHLVDINH